MKQKYSFFEIIKNVKAVIYTKLFVGKKARIVRLPFYVRGKRNLEFGEGFSTGYGCRFEMLTKTKTDEKILSIGKNFRCGDYVHITVCEGIKIGDNCLIASHVFISDNDHGSYSGDHQSPPTQPPNEREIFTKKVEIGNNVWIGENVCILPGVKIGNGCIIGAGSVVTKNIENNSIACGVPARVIKRWNENDGWKKC